MSLDEYVRESTRVANAAITAITAHQAECVQYRQAMNDKLDEHQKRIDAINKVMWATAVGVIATLATALVTLIRH